MKGSIPMEKSDNIKLKIHYTDESEGHRNFVDVQLIDGVSLEWVDVRT